MSGLDNRLISDSIKTMTATITAPNPASPSAQGVTFAPTPDEATAAAFRLSDLIDKAVPVAQATRADFIALWACMNRQVDEVAQDRAKIAHINAKIGSGPTVPQWAVDAQIASRLSDLGGASESLVATAFAIGQISDAMFFYRAAATKGV